ncbi:transcriptional regulator [Anaerobacillus sp. MEB173]|uniref:transcriptional regulator n=1 Tax=Anaerobacillus sp. MEB173 TaxID=3383345 RepID=UPI003F90F37A
MKIKIAVFGSNEFLSQIKLYEKEIKDIEIIPYVYKDPRESVKLIKHLKPCDVLFFSGVLPYYFSKMEIENLHIPIVHLSLDEHALTLSLLYIQHHYQIPIERIAIDLADKKYIENVVNDLKLSPKNLYIKDYPSILENNKQSFKLEEIINFHTTLWNNDKVSLVLTSIHAVYDQLTQKGINCLKMIDPEKTIIDSLYEAKTIGELEKRNKSQIAVGLISIGQHISEQDTIFDDVNKILITFAKTINASIHLEKDYFILFGTKGSIEDVTEQLTSLPLLSEIEGKTTSVINIGFGFGLTTKDAKNHAKIALKHAQNSPDKNSAFIITEDKRIIGPLNEDKKQYRLKTEDQEIQNLAKKLQLSTTNMDKVIQFIKSRNTSHFTSNDLADYLDVSRRTAERILKKFLTHDYLSIVGEEKPFSQGRPRAVYELKLPIRYLY